MLVYVSGPYTANESGTIEEHVDRAENIAIELWRKGHAVICPHSNTHFSGKKVDLAWNTWIEGDLNMIARCDAMVLTEDWETSQGARIERQYALNLGIPVYEYPDLPELHTTEVRCPNQVKAFREMVGGMYRLHLDKNADYSPANILGAGEIGVVTRIWDKVARLMNLTGFKIDLKTKIEFVAPKEPKNEPIQDSYYDLANYAVIGLLVKNGKWGN